MNRLKSYFFYILPICIIYVICSLHFGESPYFEGIRHILAGIGLGSIGLFIETLVELFRENRRIDQAIKELNAQTDKMMQEYLKITEHKNE